MQIWFRFLLLLPLVGCSPTIADEICNGKVQKIETKTLIDGIYEHVFKYKAKGSNIHVKFLSDAPEFVHKKKLLWYAPIRSKLPDYHDIKYMKKVLPEVDIGGIQDGDNLDADGWGLPANVENFNLFYQDCVTPSYKTFAALGRSRGGLSFINFINKHKPTNQVPKFELFIGIYPVFNWESYPTIPYLTEKTQFKYDYLREENPINAKNLAKFSESVGEIFILHGDSDQVVSYEMNSLLLEKFDNVDVNLIKGEGHNVSDKFFSNENLMQLLDEFFIRDAHQ